MFLSINQGVSREYKDISIYTPSIADIFSYQGSRVDNNTQFLEQKVYNTTTTNGLLLQQIAKIGLYQIENINNATLEVLSITTSSIGTNVTVHGVKNATGSYFKNDSKILSIGSSNWVNTSSTDPLTDHPYTDTNPANFSYTTDKNPSSMVLGDTEMVEVGQTEIPFWGSDENGNGGPQTGCSPQDSAQFVIENGNITIPFMDLSQMSLKAIFNASTFNRTGFDANNQGWTNNHAYENISWSLLEPGRISGINSVYNGLNVVLVFQWEQNFGSGMYEAWDSYCTNTNPLQLFGNFSIIHVRWNNYNSTNRPFTINGNQYTLNTITYEGTNTTSLKLYKNIPLWDSGIFAMANMSLDIDIKITFEYDSATAFLVRFGTAFKAHLTQYINNVTVPLGDSGFMGILNVNSSMIAQSNMDFTLQHHSKLYQIKTTTPTSTIQTITTSQSQSQSQSTLTTTDYPGYILLLSLSVLLIFRKKYHK